MRNYDVTQRNNDAVNLILRIQHWIKMKSIIKQKQQLEMFYKRIIIWSVLAEWMHVSRHSKVQSIGNIKIPDTECGPRIKSEGEIQRGWVKTDIFLSVI